MDGKKHAGAGGLFSVEFYLFVQFLKMNYFALEYIYTWVRNITGQCRLQSFYFLKNAA